MSEVLEKAATNPGRPLRETVSDVEEFCSKANLEAVHYELVDSSRATDWQEVLYVSAMAKGNGHIVKLEVRRPGPTAVDELLLVVEALRRRGANVTPGRWT